LAKPHEVVWALTQVASATEDHDDAHRLAIDAEVLARTLPNNAQVVALINLAAAFGKLNATDHALEVSADARALTYELPISVQTRALSRLVSAIASFAHPDNEDLLDFARRVLTEAEEAAGHVPSGWDGVRTRDEFIAAMAAMGEFEKAETQARSLSRPQETLSAFGKLVVALAESGDRANASRLASSAEQLMATIDDPEVQVRAVVDMAAAVGEAGDYDHARRLAGEAERIVLARIPNALKRFRAATSVVTTLVKIGDIDAARHQAQSVVEHTARELLTAWDHEYEVSVILAKLIPSLVGAGATDDDIASAESVVCSLPNPEHRRDALVGLTEALAAAGHNDHARRLAIEIENGARAFDASVYRIDDHIRLVEVLVLAGERRHGLLLADYLAEAIDHMLDDDVRAEMHDRLDRALADGDAHTAAEYAVDDAMSLFEMAVRQMDDDQRAALAKKLEIEREVSAFITAGNHSRAIELAQSASEPENRAKLLVQIAIGAARSDLLDDARWILAEAEVIAQNITHTETRYRILKELAAGFAQTGDLARAELIAGTIGDRWERATTLGRIAAARGIASHDAKRLLARAWLIGPWRSVFTAAGTVAIDILRAIADDAMENPLPM